MNTENEQYKGGVTADEAAAPEAEEARPPAKVAVKRRLEREGRWLKAEIVRDRMMAECRAKGMGKEEAQAWTYPELDRLFPPLPKPEPDVEPQPAGDGQLQGLGEIPADWGELPENASLQAEVGWVQASRLTIVEDLPSGATRVHLERARSPAPSMAALGWLETSIRSYAKYVDVVARSLAVVQDEQDQLRRERLAMDEIDELLQQMEE